MGRLRLGVFLTLVVLHIQMCPATAVFIPTLAERLVRSTLSSTLCQYVSARSASEETLISDRLPNAEAKLKLKPTCNEWQRLFPLAKGGSSQYDRGRGEESGTLAPARLHQTCMRTTSPLTPLGSSHGARGTRQHRPRSQNPAHSIEQSVAQPGQHGVPDVPRRCSRPGRPPTSRLYPPKGQFYVIGLHSIAVARLAYAHLRPPPPPKGVIVIPSNITSSWSLLLGLPARAVLLTSTISYSLLIQCLPLNFQWLFHPSPSIPPPSGHIYQPAPCTT